MNKPAFRFWRFLPVDRSNRGLSLHTRVGLVLTGLAAVLLLLIGGLWLHGTRLGVHEEVEAATRVSEQWLKVVLGEMRDVPAEAYRERLLDTARSLGRIRANVLEIEAADDGRSLYQSPPTAYKAGRSAPGWFAAALTPEFMPRTLEAGGLRLTLRPDPSRAVLDAWDDLVAYAGWALLLLVALFVGSRFALGRALRPLDQVMAALDRTGRGRFDTRLPVFATPELGRLSRAFNGMADRLADAVDDNVRLDTEREVAQRLQGRLEEERRDIARELHDELAQGITAVRALAGAIVQRSDEAPGVAMPAQCIVTTAGEMQEGVRHILLRLRPPAEQGVPLATLLDGLCARWREQHPDIALAGDFGQVGGHLGEALQQGILRIVQEGLTNVVRHAGASRVDLTLRQEAGALHLALSDNGRGSPAGGQASPNAGCGIGLSGMAERVAALGGELAIDRPALGGFGLRIRLPLPKSQEENA